MSARSVAYWYYDFRPNRSHAGPREMLAEFRGVLHTDGHSAYESLVQKCTERLVSTGCSMHARRCFDEALATSRQPLVAETLARIQPLYDVDDRAKGRSCGDRRALHERESRPIVERLFTSWGDTFPSLRPTTKLAEAIGYTMNRRDALLRFLDDDRIPLQDSTHGR